MYLTENEQMYSNIIKEEYGITNSSKLNWMSKMAQIHQVYESRKGIQSINEGMDPGTMSDGNIYATPLSTLGAANPMMPQGPKGIGDMGNTGSDYHSLAYQNGSGDVPMSTLTTALEIAAVTIGFDLVPVVPATGPMAILTFVDYPYAGGKLGKVNETAFDGKGAGDDNKPIYIKVSGDDAAIRTAKKAVEDSGLKYPQFAIETTTATGSTATVTGLYMGNSRIDNDIILKIVSVQETNKAGNTADCSIATALAGCQKATLTSEAVTALKGIKLRDVTVEQGKVEAIVRPELVKGVTDFIQSFGNFYGDEPNDEPMTRAQNETGTGNVIGARMFSKMIQMGSYEATGTVTRQQLQDMPLYGIDVIAGVMEVMQNQISQEINNRILDRLFKLGVENYKVQRNYQNVDLNLYIGGANDGQETKHLNKFACYQKYVDLNGKTVADAEINNAIQNTAAENVTTHQRRIASRCLAAANLIANVTRKGRGEYIVTNVQVLTALQDCSQFVVAPMSNNLSQVGNESLYYAGTLAGMQVYVDPYMTWDDTRILVGRRASVTNNKVNGSGVVFMPYILADTVQIVAEGTMAPKMLMNSRFAVVDCGFYPEQNYYTFMVDFKEGTLI